MSNHRATTDQYEILNWAEQHNYQPVEILPSDYDSEPAQMAFVTPAEIVGDYRGLAWDQFFALFAVQDLALVYDVGTDHEGATDFYEIVHDQPRSPRS